MLSTNSNSICSTNSKNIRFLSERWWEVLPVEPYFWAKGTKDFQKFIENNIKKNFTYIKCRMAHMTSKFVISGLDQSWCLTSVWTSSFAPDFVTKILLQEAHDFDYFLSYCLWLNFTHYHASSIIADICLAKLNNMDKT